MNPTSPSPEPHPEPTREEIMASLFVTMVMQQTQMALMLLGQIPHPETGEAVMDLEGAQMFIEQLEMLAVKTKGNLSKDEDELLKQSLVGVRMAFVQAAQLHEHSTLPTAPAAPVAEKPALVVETPPAAAPAEEESRKKFSKRY